MEKTRKIKKTVKAIIIVGLLIAVISFVTSPQKVTDQEFIEETLETADDSTFATEKEMLAELVQKYYDCNPEKVVFFVTAPQSGWDYHVNIYYKTESKTDSAEWYKKSLGWLSPKISRELDDLLIRVAMHSQQ